MGTLVVFQPLIPLPVIFSVALKDLRTHGIEGLGTVVLLLLMTPTGGANNVSVVVN